MAKQEKVSRPPRRQSGTGTWQRTQLIETGKGFDGLSPNSIAGERLRYLSPNGAKKFGFGRFEGQSTNSPRLRLALRVLRFASQRNCALTLKTIRLVLKQNCDATLKTGLTNQHK